MNKRETRGSKSPCRRPSITNCACGSDWTARDGGGHHGTNEADTAYRRVDRLTPRLKYNHSLAMPVRSGTHDVYSFYLFVCLIDLAVLERRWTMAVPTEKNNNKNTHTSGVSRENHCPHRLCGNPTPGVTRRESAFRICARSHTLLRELNSTVALRVLHRLDQGRVLV